MSIPARTKHLLVAHAHLRAAARLVSAKLQPNAPDTQVPVEDAANALAQPGLLICMDSLATRGMHENPRGGFWRELERAAKALGVTDRAVIYRSRFLATLDQGSTQHGESPP